MGRHSHPMDMLAARRAQGEMQRQAAAGGAQNVPDWVFQSTIESVVEPKVEVALALKEEFARCRAAGEPVPDVTITPDQQDVVVALFLDVIKPSRVLVGKAQVMRKKVLELQRYPLLELTGEFEQRASAATESPSEG